MMELYCRDIYYYETDRMAIVHNSNYLRIFEESRLFHLAQSGVDYLKMEQDGIMIPQTDAYVKYRIPLRYGDIIKVAVELSTFNGVTMKYDYSIYKNDDEIPAATGYTCHCFMDSTTRLPLSIKRKMPEIYEIMLKSVKSITHD